MQPDPREDQKRAAARAALDQVREGMVLGLGTGSTVAHFLSELALRRSAVTCVGTSPATERMARSLGLVVRSFDSLKSLDLAVDGADQVAPDLWLVKGGGGAHTREKVAAAAADRFVVIVSRDKLVDRLGPPVPLEVLQFGFAATLSQISDLGPARRRPVPPTPDGNFLVDFTGDVEDPASLSSALESIPGVVGHGLFRADLVSEVLVGGPDGRVERLGES